MTERTCKTCSAFHHSQGDIGECRAKPPIGIPQMQMNPVAQRPELRILGGWPPTSTKQWCRDDWKPAHDHQH